MLLENLGIQMNQTSKYPTKIDLCDGKYTLIYDFETGQSECLRNGLPWRDLCGDKMVLACFDEIVEARQQRDALLKACHTLVGLLDTEDWQETLRLAVQQAREAIKMMDAQ